MEEVRKWAAVLLAVCVLGGAFFPFAQVFAAPLKGYEALQVTGSKVAMAPGETKQVTFGFQNTGTQTWNRDAGAFISVYTYGPKYRTSVFQDTGWYGATQPAKLTETTVKPGEVGHVTFAMKAPSTPGTYAETFMLAAEDVAWIPGGEFTVHITVGSGSTATTSSIASPVSTSPPPPTVSGLSGIVLLRSAKKITATANERISFTVGIKNTGTVSWEKREVHTSDVQAASISSSTRLALKDTDTVAPGAMDLIDFSFRAPSTKGTHVVKLALVVDGVVVPDVELSIPVEVTTGSPAIKDVPVEDETAARADVQIAEPTVRIGVLIVDSETDDKVDVSCASDWKLYDGDGQLLAELKKDEVVGAFYKKDRYWYNRGKGLEKTNSYLRFVPNEKDAVCTVENFDRTKTRGAAYPDNEFRNILELRYNSAHDRTWLINELDTEMYLRGLGETSNISHKEFQKALITVARTYALYHFERGTKHKDEYFHMNAYADDQVYRGYGQEKRSPRLVESVQKTEGVVVTYEGKTAITPYFSRSDGRTRDWGEVWYGDVPWLKSVAAPCDKGKTLWGHGVGMSASEALCQANNGKAWDDILTYFYTGIDLVKKWE